MVLLITKCHYAKYHSPSGELGHRLLAITQGTRSINMPLITRASDIFSGKTEAPMRMSSSSSSSSSTEFSPWNLILNSPDASISVTTVEDVRVSATRYSAGEHLNIILSYTVKNIVVARMLIVLLWWTLTIVAIAAIKDARGRTMQSLFGARCINTDCREHCLNSNVDFRRLPEPVPNSARGKALLDHDACDFHDCQFDLLFSRVSRAEYLVNSVSYDEPVRRTDSGFNITFVLAAMLVIQRISGFKCRNVQK